jgi:glycosyltransferase involved in cell wall biosynthesis
VVHTRRWVEYFRGRGHEVRLWSLEPDGDALGARRLPAWPLPGFARYPLAAPALARALGDYAPDLVDAHYVPNYGLLGALVNRHPLSVAAWGSDLLVAGTRGALQRARARFVLRRADLVLTDAENLARSARTLGARAERVHAIPWGVDLARFRPRADREPELIVTTRMHEPIYDLPTVIAGAAPVLERRPAACLVIAGDGSRRAELERLAAARLPAGRYQFTGHLDADALAGWLGRAAVYVSGSRSDSTSVSLLEAMAAGAVPVVSDIAGNREWIGDGVGGRLFAGGDARALTSALESALSEPAWAADVRAHNRGVVEARGDWTRNMGRIESLFESLVKGTV